MLIICKKCGNITTYLNEEMKDVRPGHNIRAKCKLCNYDMHEVIENNDSNKVEKDIKKRG